MAHSNLAAVLRAAGSSEDQILRQHIWQRDKRFFPCYEAVRVHFQAVPAPSSGLGVSSIIGHARDWIGMDAIAVVPGENPALPARSVISAVDNRNLPSASHYSLSVRSGELVFRAGHIAIRTAEPGKPLVNSFDDVPKEGRFLATGRSHPDSRDGPIAAQAWYIYNELQKLLAAGGLSFSDVVLSSVFLANFLSIWPPHGSRSPSRMRSTSSRHAGRRCRVLEPEAIACASPQGEAPGNM
jgi:enamine deaminase RidA (YjgF/YER057c/UK114 family)